MVHDNNYKVTFCTSWQKDKVFIIIIIFLFLELRFIKFSTPHSREHNIFPNQGGYLYPGAAGGAKERTSKDIVGLPRGRIRALSELDCIYLITVYMLIEKKNQNNRIPITNRRVPFCAALCSGPISSPYTTPYPVFCGPNPPPTGAYERFS